MTAALRPAKSMSLALGRSVNRADVDTNLTFDPAGRKTVIVDDCVDSGISVARVRELLLSKGAASVQVAVLCWATKFDSEALHGVTPDIYLGRRLHYFPWALNNPEYSQFRDWVQKHGHASWR
jgi:hypoxanthine phosphoribosyltransferase